MILDSKVIMHPPPPPYAPPEFHPIPTLPTLPPHILLQIIYLTLPHTSPPDVERQRKALYWISISLRLVNRALYTASMHVLRSLHIPAYHALVRKPYSSDPFPLLVDALSPSISTPYSSPSQIRSLTLTLQRETAVLDRFIALKVREDVWADESELHLERDEAYKDMFDHTQPRARLEDLVREYGVAAGVVSVPQAQTPASSLRERASMSSVRPPSDFEADTESKPQLFPDATDGPTPPYPYPYPYPDSPTLPLPSLRSPSPTPSSSSSSPATTSSLPRPKSTFLSSLSLFTRSKPTSPSPSPSSPSANSPSTPLIPKSPAAAAAPAPTAAAAAAPKPKPIPISQLSVTLAPRSAGLVLSTPTSTKTRTKTAPGRRTIVSTPRARDEPLEAAAASLVRGLRGWLEGA
ncbi:hypothetical protein H0H92_007881 [Tricholoma furcatifolium]|nr:hypothetical protein H0H92_007881 [Tricholoma furcatifolium]